MNINEIINHTGDDLAIVDGEGWPIGPVLEAVGGEVTAVVESRSHTFDNTLDESALIVNTINNVRVVGLPDPEEGVFHLVDDAAWQVCVAMGRDDVLRPIITQSGAGLAAIELPTGKVLSFGKGTTRCVSSDTGKTADPTLEALLAS